MFSVDLLDFNISHRKKKSLWRRLTPSVVLKNVHESTSSQSSRSPPSRTPRGQECGKGPLHPQRRGHADGCHHAHDDSRCPVAAQLATATAYSTPEEVGGAMDFAEPFRSYSTATSRSRTVPGRNERQYPWWHRQPRAWCMDDTPRPASLAALFLGSRTCNANSTPGGRSKQPEKGQRQCPQLPQLPQLNRRSPGEESEGRQRPQPKGKPTSCPHLTAAPYTPVSCC